MRTGRAAVLATGGGLPEKPLLVLLAAVQFTHIMDFMIMMPLGPMLMRELSISAAQFSALIAAYTMTAGAVGLASAPFIDRFDRKRVLVFAYAGFIAGTYLCAVSETGGGSWSPAPSAARLEGSRMP